MSSSGPFRIVEHTVPCQHIREYPHATSNSQEDTLYLAVKQYIPLDNPDPQPGDVTIIGAHANGFPKVGTCLSTYYLISAIQVGLLDADTITRSYMNHYGKRSTRARKTMASGSEASGWQMLRIKDRAECSMRTAWVTIVCLPLSSNPQLFWSLR